MLEAIQQDTDALGFALASEPKTGALFTALAASKPGGLFLELGTGTGLGTAWLLAGMDADARLATVDTDAEVVAVAQRHLATDSRVTFHVMDGAEFISRSAPAQFDLVYADAWPGKSSHLDEALSSCAVEASTSSTICFLSAISPSDQDVTTGGRRE